MTPSAGTHFSFWWWTRWCRLMMMSLVSFWSCYRTCTTLLDLKPPCFCRLQAATVFLCCTLECCCTKDVSFWDCVGRLRGLIKPPQILHYIWIAQMQYRDWGYHGRINILYIPSSNLCTRWASTSSTKPSGRVRLIFKDWMWYALPLQ